MAKALSLKKPWIVIEGLFDISVFQNDVCSVKNENNKFVFSYIGSISKKYGINSLVEGFRIADICSAELHIYGDGEYVNELKHECSLSPNIIYHGFVDYKSARAAMKRSDVLVNPRPSTEPFTEYSCPSKTLEYMSSGTATLITKLDGIPEEYYQYVYMIDNETPNGIAYALKEVYSLSKDERIEKGNAARKFIMNEKNSQKQIEKLISFIDKN